MRLLSCVALLAVSCASLPGAIVPSAGSRQALVEPDRLFEGSSKFSFPESEAGASDSEPVATQDPEVPLEVAAIMTRLSAARLAFFDPQTLESFRAVGPYRIVSWGESELKLVGYDADGLGAAHIDVRTEPDSMWVVAQIRDREFLLRVD